MTLKCCDMTAAMLRTSVTFERATLTSDGVGGHTSTWAVIPGSSTRAHVRGLSGWERMQADRLNAETRERIVVRWFAGLRPDDRVVIEGRRYQIHYINDLERRHRWYEIDLQGGVPT